MQMLSGLTLIRVKSSIVVNSPIEECWRVCRAWGRQVQSLPRAAKNTIPLTRRRLYMKH